MTQCCLFPEDDEHTKELKASVKKYLMDDSDGLLGKSSLFEKVKTFVEKILTSCSGNRKVISGKKLSKILSDDLNVPKKMHDTGVDYSKDQDAYERQHSVEVARDKRKD